MTRFFAILILSSSFLGCTVNVNDTEDDKAAIQEAARAFSKAYVNGDLEEQMKYYTADAAILPGSRNMIIGIEGVTNYWNIPAELKVLNHKSTSSSLEISGDMASDYGYYEGVSVRNNDTTSFRGQYVIVWERGDDHKWRMAVDMWSALRN